MGEILINPFARIGRTGALLLLVMGLVFSGGLGAAAAPTPEYVEGNPTCQDLGYEQGFKIELADGTTNFDGSYYFLYGARTMRLDITNSSSYSFDWLSRMVGMDAVIVKAGPGAFVYAYNPEAWYDTGLYSPNNLGGNQAAISHIDFCFDVELVCRLGHPVVKPR